MVDPDFLDQSKWEPSSKIPITWTRQQGACFEIVQEDETTFSARVNNRVPPPLKQSFPSFLKAAEAAWEWYEESRQDFETVS
jgi:hypothetical protein